MIVELHHVVRAVHVDLNFVFLELFEFVLLEVVGERTLCAAEVAAKHEKLVIASLVQKATVDRGLLAH